MLTTRAIPSVAMASITAPEENDAILGSLAIAGPVRIGFANTLGAWRWVSGEAAPFAIWAAGEPQICPTSGDVSGLLDPSGWRTACLDDEYPFVCEIEPWLVRDDDHAYRISYAEVDWFGAKAFCEGLGGHLATITSAAEHAFVTQLILFDLWIGLSTLDGVSYQWTTGEPLGGFAPWNPGEPAPAGQECVSQRKEQDWASGACTGQLRALCERD